MTEDIRIRLMRFRKVDPETGCWLWTGHKNDRGYGDVWWNGETWRLSHVSVIVLKKEVIPDGMIVMHTCDNPPCFNPEHLKVGTNVENMQDCLAKGRFGSRPKPFCKKGHPKPLDRECATCQKERGQKWYEKNRIQVLERMRLQYHERTAVPNPKRRG